jgi:anti-sigma regulatory factor (Ser/Thr protein kinase)
VTAAPHALCLVRDVETRRVVRRTLQAAGATVEFRDVAGEAPVAATNGLVPRLVIVDDAARRSTPMSFWIGEGAEVIALGGSLVDEDVLALLRGHVDHVIAEGGAPDEAELVVTSAKMLSGDVFGLEKYLSWGAEVQTREVSTYRQKTFALLELAEHAKRVGARRPVVARIQTVADELLMNAMYDAPAASLGRAPELPRDDQGRSQPGARAHLCYGCDGRYFAVAVADDYGALDKRAILDHFMRARVERGRPLDGDHGAGLGLYVVLAAASRFIVNLEPDVRTEVVCLFDLRETGRQQKPWARSLHVFRAGARG